MSSTCINFQINTFIRMLIIDYSKIDSKKKIEFYDKVMIVRQVT